MIGGGRARAIVRGILWPGGDGASIAGDLTRRGVPALMNLPGGREPPRVVLGSTVQNGAVLALETTVLTCAVEEVNPNLKVGIELGKSAASGCSTSESLRSSRAATCVVQVGSAVSSRNV